MIDSLDPGRLAAWLTHALGTEVTSVVVSRMSGGYSSGAWRLDVATSAGAQPMVFKAPDESTLVFRRNACREGRIMEALHQFGAPVPAVLALDCSGSVTGRPAFAMALVDARSVDDVMPAGYHGAGWFRDVGPNVQGAVWRSFHDRLAEVHRSDTARLPGGSYGEGGVVAYLDFWRAALLDVAPAELVPRHLAILEWLAAKLPNDADASPALCMGDARLANALIQGDEVVALVDFEVAYVGNPAADIGYSLTFDAMLGRFAQSRLTGIPTPDETWARWEAATGRRATNRAYWTAFGAAVLVITAARAMRRSGVRPQNIEAESLFLPDWETAVARAASCASD